MSTCTGRVGPSTVGAAGRPGGTCPGRLSCRLQPHCSDERNLHFPGLLHHCFRTLLKFLGRGDFSSIIGKRWMFPNSYPKSPPSHESRSHSDTAGCKCCVSETLAIPGNTDSRQNLKMNISVFQAWEGFAISIAQLGQGDPGLIKSSPGPGVIEQTSLLAREGKDTHTCTHTHMSIHMHEHACVNTHTDT